jgi:hypothetical protein
VVRIIAKQLPKLVEKEKDLKYCSLFTQAWISLLLQSRLSIPVKLKA